MSPDKAETYYSATANDPTRYPKLVGPVRADVCIIGGGFSGVATALLSRYFCSFFSVEVSLEPVTLPASL